MQRGPNSSALRTPLQFLTGCGSRQRKLPTGGWPNGIPLKLRTPSLAAAVDSREPFAILTRSPANEDPIVHRPIRQTGSIDRQTFIGSILYLKEARKNSV